MEENQASSNYIQSRPSDQNAVDIFKAEWSSKFPDSFGVTSSGIADLFEDQRIIWAEEQGIDFKDKRILELGPLEAAHTWMMDQRGAKEIIAIEAHERAYLKCLIVKEIAQIQSARFLHGNFDGYLESNSEKFDICLASGVLYHSTNPSLLLDQICTHCNTLILWTHYFDRKAISKHGPDLLKRFDEPTLHNHHETQIKHHPFNYQEEATKDAFCGGFEAKSIWLEREGIETILSNNGFEVRSTAFDHPHHPNGPAIAMIAQRS